MPQKVLMRNSGMKLIYLMKIMKFGRAINFMSFRFLKYAAQELKKRPSITGVENSIEKAGIWNADLFPFDSLYSWNIDNYGPLYIPKKGVTVKLNYRIFLSISD